MNENAKSLFSKKKKNLNLNIILIKTLSNFRDIVAIGVGKNPY